MTHTGGCVCLYLCAWLCMLVVCIIVQHYLLCLSKKFLKHSINITAIGFSPLVLGPKKFLKTDQSFPSMKYKNCLKVSISKPAVSDHAAVVSYQSKLTASTRIKDGHQLKPVELNIVLRYIYILKLDLIILGAESLHSVPPSLNAPTHHLLPLKYGQDIKDS